MLFQIAKLYARLVEFSIDRFGYSPPGLGWLLRRVPGERVLQIEDRKFLFSQAGASMYGLMILNKYREKETHQFLREVIDRGGEVNFIDVGAAVGEIVIDVAGYEKVAEVFAIDPDNDNLEAIRRSADLNGFKNISTISHVISDHEGPVSFVLNKAKGSSGYMLEGKIPGAEQFEATTIDRLFLETCSEREHITLIDAEGADLKVVKGAAAFIEKTRPLIVFEYNELTRKHFSLDEMRDTLGDGYTVYRLNTNGKLDQQFSDTWNCVALPKDGPFSEICRDLILSNPVRLAA